MSRKSMSERSNLKVIPRNNLRSIRITQNPRLSQWKLALQSGIPQSKISLIENCLVNPAENEKQALALALHTNILIIFPNGPKIEKGEKDENVENGGG